MIGIFDSGVGGLTVVKDIKKRLPETSIIYFGDTARLPYGNKSQETIQRYSEQIVDFLLGKGCKTIVIACNSASALAGDHLRRKYADLKIYDVVSSGAEATVEAVHLISKKRRSSMRVGVIGTTATINSSIYKRKIADLDPSIEVSVQACPLFVPLVEEDWVRRPETKKIARSYLRGLKLKKVDVLLLGCTHYPLLTNIIRGVMGQRTEVVTSGKKLAQELRKESLIAKSKKSDQYYVSDLTPHFKRLANQILGKSIKIEKIDL